jgi:hypothetical protein
MKKRLTDQQEFEIMKLVLDKFLWIGTVVMMFGLWLIIQSQIMNGIAVMAIGVIVLLIFLCMIVKEYEIISY